MGIVVQGIDRDGKYRKLLTTAEGRLFGGTTFREQNNLVAGALSTTGKIDAVAASGQLIVGVDCTTFPVEWIDWAVAFDNGWSYQFARSNSNPLSATITLADATVVDDGDTFVLNGVTWTAEATEEDVVAADHTYFIGASNAACAVNLGAALESAYGPGVTTTVAAVDATDVITINGDTATVLQFGQGTSAANEIAWAETSLLNLNVPADAVTGLTTTAANKYRDLPPHYIDGWGWGALIHTNAEASTATLDVKATRN